MTLDRLDDSLQPLPVPDVQRTTLSLDLMGRFVCNTWDEAVNNGGAPFDVVIIGSGMFGGYCADHIIRNSGLRVLVLDAGPFLVSTHLQNLPGIGLFAPNPIDPASDPGTAQPGLGDALAGRLAVRGPGLLRRREIALLGGLVPDPARRRPEYLGELLTVGGSVLEDQLPDAPAPGRHPG